MKSSLFNFMYSCFFFSSSLIFCNSAYCESPHKFHVEDNNDFDVLLKFKKETNSSSKSHSIDPVLEDKFTDAFVNNLWKNSESISGPGSTLQYTENFRKEFPALVINLKCKSILDAPCGDFNWMAKTELGNVSYIGGDIVPEMINELFIKYPGVDFRHIDITTTELPQTDLWLCRDVLFHLSNQDIQKVIDNFKKSEIHYFATSHFPNQVNTDALSGPRTYRFVNLTMAPFNLPEPICVLNDWILGHPERQIAIWDRNQLK